MKLTEQMLDEMSQEDFDALVENIDQLDELSKKTLGQYVKKASDVARGHSFNAGQRSQHLEKDGIANFEYQAKKSAKRQKGLEKAVSRLTKESAEMYTDLIQAIEESNAKDITAIFEKAMAEKLQGIFDDSKVAIVESIFSTEQSLEEAYTASGELHHGGNTHKFKVKYHDFPDHSAVQKQNPHLAKHHVDAIMNHFEEHGDDDMTDTHSTHGHEGTEVHVKHNSGYHGESFEDASQLDEISGKLLGSYIQKARADRQKKYDNENELDQHPKVKAIIDKRRDYYNRRDYDKYGNSKHQKQIDKLRAKEPEVKKKLDPNYPKSGIQGANKRGRGIEAAIKKLTQGKLTN